MEALILTVFVSVVLSALAVTLFVWDVRQGGHDHHDRLSLLPLDRAPSRRNTTAMTATPTPPTPHVTTDKGNDA